MNYWWQNIKNKFRILRTFLTDRYDLAQRLELQSQIARFKVERNEMLRLLTLHKNKHHRNNWVFMDHHEELWEIDKILRRDA
jgi:hypothetical protein